MAVKCRFTRLTVGLLSVGTVNPRVLLFLGIVTQKIYFCVKMCLIE